MHSDVKPRDQRSYQVYVHYTKRRFLKELLDRLDVRWVEARKGIFSSQIQYWVDSERDDDVTSRVRALCQRMI